MSNRSQCSEQFVIFISGADSDAKTVLAERYAGTVAHYDAFLNEVVVNLLCISNLSKEEISISRIDLLANLQFAEGSYHTTALLQ